MGGINLHLTDMAGQAYHTRTVESRHPIRRITPGGDVTPRLEIALAPDDQMRFTRWDRRADRRSVAHGKRGGMLKPIPDRRVLCDRVSTGVSLGNNS
jgi:hypothetical protein